MPRWTVCRLFLGAALLLSGEAAVLVAAPSPNPTPGVASPSRDARVVAALRILKEPKARSRHRRAFRALLQAESAGSTQAALALAKITGRGLFGHPKDQEAARRHLEQAAAGGSRSAAQWLAANPAEEELVIDLGIGTPALGPTGTPGGRPGFGPPPPQEFLEHIREVLLFRQDRCPPCEFFEPIAQRVFETPRSVRLRVIDLATDEGLLLASKHGIQGTPTTVLTAENGDSLMQIVGPMPAAEFEDLIRQCGVPSGATSAP